MKVNWKCVICAHSRRSKTKHSFTTLRWNTKRKRDLTVLAVIVNSTLNIRWKDISKVRFKLDQNLTLFGTGFEMKEKKMSIIIAPPRINFYKPQLAGHDVKFNSILVNFYQSKIWNVLLKLQMKIQAINHKGVKISFPVPNRVN